MSVLDVPAITLGLGDARYAKRASATLNAKDYGAKGDGTSDDTAALQAAFDALLPGDVLDLGRGTYKHVNLTVSGKAQFALIGDGAVLKATTTTVQYLRFLNCSDFTVRGITSSGFNATIRQNPTRGFSIEGCTRFRITGCHAYNTEGVGIYMSTSVEGVVANNFVHDTYADGIHMTNSCKRIVVSGNTINNSGDDSIAVVSYQSNGDVVENISITGNVSYHSKSRGIAVVGGKCIAISGNTIRDPQNAGVYIAYESSYSTYGVQDVTVSGNTIVGANTYNSPTTNYAAVHVVGNNTAAYNLTGISITGNTIDNSAWHGVVLGAGAAGCYSFNFSNNTVRNSGSNGILIQAVQDLTLQSNLIDTSVGSGIFLTGALGVLSVIGNIIRNPCTSAANTIGVNLPASAISRGIIANNIVYDISGNATTLFSTSTANNVSVYGNSIGGNLVAGVAATALPFVAPGNVLMAGALESNGTGSGVGVLGLRNATTVPTSNPGSGVVAYANNGSLEVRDANGTVTRVAGTLRKITASYTVLAADSTILATGTGITVTLPSAVIVGTGREYKIKNSGTSNVTVASTAGGFDGAATATMTLASLDGYTYVSDGTNWVVF